MRKLVLDNLVSLDGYFGGPNNEIDWFAFDEESLDRSRNLLRGAGSIVMGRWTFEWMAQHWPTSQARTEEPYISERLSELAKFVFARTLTSSTWQDTRFVRRPVAEVIREEKQGSGGHLLLLGSSSILAPLWKEHLVDEAQIRIQPSFSGGGALCSRGPTSGSRWRRKRVECSSRVWRRPATRLCRRRPRREPAPVDGGNEPAPRPGSNPRDGGTP